MSMKKTKNKSSLTTLVKQSGRIKINTKLNSIEDAPFFKKKMNKGAKMLLIAGLPK
jgi:hypothetical protein